MGMDTVRELDGGPNGSLDDGRNGSSNGGLNDTRNARTAFVREMTDAGVNDVMFDLGGDERRMHVRAYNHWVSLLQDRPYPSIANLQPETIADFGPHSVLLDFSHGMGDPRIAYLGRALREECGLDGPIATIADVPSRSLLSRLTDHYLQIIANRAPIGFEAEFVSSRGRTTLYRGILMPFSSSGDSINFIYGVINWKELADADMMAALSAELHASVLATAPAPSDVTQVWADGPSGGFGIEGNETAAVAVQDPVSNAPMPAEDGLTGPLGEQLAMARESAAQARAAEARSRAALHRALARAHDFSLSAESDGNDHTILLSPACLPGQTGPMIQVVKLVFGPALDETKLSDFAAVLRHARRHQVPAGGLASFLDGFGGDLSAIIDAERSAI